MKEGGQRERKRLSIAVNTSGWQTEINSWFWLLCSKSLNFWERDDLEGWLYWHDLRSKGGWLMHCALPWAGIRRGGERERMT